MTELLSQKDRQGLYKAARPLLDRVVGTRLEADTAKSELLAAAVLASDGGWTPEELTALFTSAYRWSPALTNLREVRRCCDRLGGDALQRLEADHAQTLTQLRAVLRRKTEGGLSREDGYALASLLNPLYHRYMNRHGDSSAARGHLINVFSVAAQEAGDWSWDDLAALLHNPWPYRGRFATAREFVDSYSGWTVQRLQEFREVNADVIAKVRRVLKRRIDPYAAPEGHVRWDRIPEGLRVRDGQAPRRDGYYHVRQLEVVPSGGAKTLLRRHLCLLRLQGVEVFPGVASLRKDALLVYADCLEDHGRPESAALARQVAGA